MVEIAVAAPVLVFILLGSVNLAVYIGDKMVMSQASRDGARLASVLGGGRGVSPPPLGSTYDAEVVQAVRSAAAAVAYAGLKEIDIYAPSRADGAYTVGDPVDAFDGTGKAMGLQTFPLVLRTQVVPAETSVGVRVVWQYFPATVPNFAAVSNAEYTVFKALAVP